MKIRPLDQHPQRDVEMEGVRATKMRLLIGPQDGASNFHMRHFEVAPGGHSPYHSHDYEHEILVLSGNGVIVGSDGEHPIKTGDVVFVATNEEHQFANRGEDPLGFVCLIVAPEECAK